MLWAYMSDFFSTNQVLILRLLFAHPQSEYSMAEIGRAVGKKPGVFKKALDSLERQGIVLTHFKGNQRLVSINGAYPLHAEVKALFLRTHGVETQLKTILKEIPGLDIAIIYGSYASGQLRPDSDIDLLLVAGDMDVEEEIIRKFQEVETQIRREVNHRLYTASAFKTKRQNGDPFLREILSSPHIVLKGVVS